MDMMAMALLFDMASRNRRWDEQFEPRRPGRTRTFAKRLLAALFSKRRTEETPGIAPEPGAFPAWAAAND